MISDNSHEWEPEMNKSSFSDLELQQFEYLLQRIGKRMMLYFMEFAYSYLEKQNVNYRKQADMENIISSLQQQVYDLQAENQALKIKLSSARDMEQAIHWQDQYEKGFTEY